MKKRRRCANCGAVLELTEERHYIAVNEGKSDGALFSKPVFIDAYDCQVCGRQFMAGIRAKKVEVRKV